MKRFGIITGVALSVFAGIAAAQYTAKLGGTQTVVTGATIDGATARIDTLYTWRSATGDTILPASTTTARPPWLKITATGTSSVVTAANAADSAWTITVKGLNFGTYATSGAAVVSSAVVSDFPIPALTDSLRFVPSFPTTAGGARSVSFFVRNTCNSYQIIVRNKANTSVTEYKLQWEPWSE